MKHRATFFLLALCYIMNVNARILHRHRHHRKLQRGYQRGVPAMGFNFNGGCNWSIICQTPHGKIPGIMKSNRQMSYTFRGSEHHCPFAQKFISGKLIAWDIKGSYSCKPQGFDKGMGPLYAALIVTPFGHFPGKASKARRMAWYSMNKMEKSTRSNFYYIC